MSDERLRQLERRWRDTAAVDDEAAYLAERVRVGDLASVRLELAAYSGNQGAARALGTGPRPPDKVGEWVEGFDRWGKAACVRAGIALAEASLRYFSQPEGLDLLRRSLEAAKAWARCPCPEHETAAAEAEAASRTVSYTPALGAVSPTAIAAARASIHVAADAGTPGEGCLWAPMCAEDLAHALGDAWVRATIGQALADWALGGADPATP